jgi:hypothetical protein
MIKVDKVWYIPLGPVRSRFVPLSTLNVRFSTSLWQETTSANVRSVRGVRDTGILEVESIDILQQQTKLVRTCFPWVYVL